MKNIVLIAGLGVLAFAWYRHTHKASITNATSTAQTLPASGGGDAGLAAMDSGHGTASTFAPVLGTDTKSVTQDVTRMASPDALAGADSACGTCTAFHPLEF